ncbi:MAG: hypothetical protein Q8936_13580 [Bacillota bacterium]|nr:hypothetical protein [Bacillota bacterium]
MKNKKYEGLVDEPSNMPSIPKNVVNEEYLSTNIEKSKDKTLEIGNRIIEIHSK